VRADHPAQTDRLQRCALEKLTGLATHLSKVVHILYNGRIKVDLVFRVRDVRETHRALGETGLSFLTPPQQPPWGGWRCFAQDPDGYLIEIEQP